MRKFEVVFFVLIVLASFLFVVGCGGGGEESPAEQAQEKAVNVSGDAEQIRQAVKEKMKRMQDRIEEMTAADAHEMAQEEALKWDMSAKLYYLEGEDALKRDGTAKKWSAYFAVQEDADSTPSRDHGKKFVVLMMGGRIVSMEKKETPDEISYTKECHAFLPENWMSAAEAYTRCFEALNEKHEERADGAIPERIELLGGEYYVASKWIVKPTWRLTLDAAGSPLSASIHAVSGEVLEVK